MPLTYIGTLDIDPILISSVVIPSCHVIVQKVGFYGFSGGNRPTPRRRGSKKEVTSPITNKVSFFVICDVTMDSWRVLVLESTKKYETESFIFGDRFHPKTTQVPLDNEVNYEVRKIKYVLSADFACNSTFDNPCKQSRGNKIG